MDEPAADPIDVEPDRCRQCGRLPTINGNQEEILLLTDGGFMHRVCDDRWDP